MHWKGIGIFVSNCATKFYSYFEVKWAGETCAQIKYRIMLFMLRNLLFGIESYIILFQAICHVCLDRSTLPEIWLLWQSFSYNFIYLWGKRFRSMWPLIKSISNFTNLQIDNLRMNVLKKYLCCNCMEFLRVVRFIS